MHCPRRTNSDQLVSTRLRRLVLWNIHQSGNTGRLLSILTRRVTYLERKRVIEEMESDDVAINHPRVRSIWYQSLLAVGHEDRITRTLP